ncbi:MAG: hypothetical protein R3C60_08310 [Parvularculaceae bacterium]
MPQENTGLVGEIAAHRPILAASVIATGLTALAISGFRAAGIGYIERADAMLFAAAIMTAAPALIAAFAPRNFWLRIVYALTAAGLIFGARRIAASHAPLLPTLDMNLCLGVASLLTLFLGAGAPLWRGILANAFVGLAAMVLGLAGALGLAALFSSNGEILFGVGAAFGVSLGLAGAMSAFVPAQFATKSLVLTDVRQAAAASAQAATAPFLFAILISAVSFASLAHSSGAAWFRAIYFAIAIIGLLTVPSIILGAGALAKRISLASPAREEETRKGGLRRLLDLLRLALPASSSLAFVAMLGILLLVVSFETRTPISIPEIAVIASAGLFALAAFVSVRTALMIVATLAISTRFSIFLFEISAAPAPAVEARLAAELIAAILFSWLYLSWRDSRNPRLKTREVTRRAIGQAYFAYIAAAALSSAAIAASAAGGVWPNGEAAALFVLILAIAGGAIAPPLMTATGALFGRD